MQGSPTVAITSRITSVATEAQVPTSERFVDRTRQRFVIVVASVWLLGAAWAAVAQLPDVAVALSLPALIAIRMAMLDVVATDEGVRVRGFFTTRFFEWSEVSHFELKRFGLRETAVPTVVLTDGRRYALYGLDSALSGFGARSPMWEPTLRRLSERLTEVRFGHRRRRAR